MVVAGVVEHVRELVGRGRGELRLVVASFEKTLASSWSVQASVGPADGSHLAAAATATVVSFLLLKFHCRAG